MPQLGHVAVAGRLVCGDSLCTSSLFSCSPYRLSLSNRNYVCLSVQASSMVAVGLALAAAGFAG